MKSIDELRNERKRIDIEYLENQKKMELLDGVVFRDDGSISQSLILLGVLLILYFVFKEKSGFSILNFLIKFSYPIVLFRIYLNNQKIGFYKELKKKRDELGKRMNEIEREIRLKPFR